ncbi:hypothetical protein AMATHDRAFT_156564 [Amanita thiersii Skay4041]|uniref:Ferritin-like domain-containing protein n=1 Tax=Amanita thiersii Skay4041 TaxID=703135 RepID=A0A2A9N723_9AGAR|nr:hypothetical protein AMATHDRAFT_156564 [Amanita thiersii Skay4041]
MLYTSLVLLAVSSGAFAAPALSRRTNNDLLVMKFADVLEQMESEFYSQAIAKFQEPDFTTAGFTSSQIPLEQFSSIHADEQTHSTGLQAAIKSAGDMPVTTCKFSFDSVLGDVSTMAAVGRVVENVGVGAYLGAAHLISDPVLLTTAGSILTVEARHQTILNVLSSTGSAIPAAFDIALKPEEVLAIASPFISGCDLGITANPNLAVTNTGNVGPGTLLTFSSPAMNGSVSQESLFCQMIVGGAPVAIPLPLSQCIVPDGINGPVALFITNDVQPLANDVVNRASDKLVAGPTIAFIDTKPQMLGQLARSGITSGSGNSTDSASSVTRTVSPSEATSILEGASSTTIIGVSSVAPTSTATGASSTESAATASATDAASSSAGKSAATDGSGASGTATATASSPTASGGASNIFVGSSNGPNLYKGDTLGGVVIDGWSMVAMPSSSSSPNKN